MRSTVLVLGLVLAGFELPRDNVCWIDPMTGRPYLSKCDKAKKQGRSPAPEKAKETQEQPKKTSE